METFKFEAWIHPKNGGDDRQVELEVKAKNSKAANKEVKNWLSKRSDIVEDFKQVN